MRGLIAGVLALSLLEAVLNSNGAAQRVGGFYTLAAGVLNHLIDPSVPLIPDKRAK